MTIGQNFRPLDLTVILGGSTVVIGDEVEVRAGAVVERTSIGPGSIIGSRAYVADSNLAPGTVIPDGATVIDNQLRGFVEWSEVEGIHRSEGTRAHREDVAQDSADAGGGALIRLDERRVIVRFDLEGRGQSAAYIDYAGVFARALQHAFAFGG